MRKEEELFLSSGNNYQSDYNQNDLINLEIATNPEIDLSQLPEIDYESLDAAWSKQKVEMLIIVNDSSFVSAVTPLMDWKNEKGVKTVIL